VPMAIVENASDTPESPTVVVDDSSV
jgi:hypothetical protein